MKRRATHRPGKLHREVVRPQPKRASSLRPKVVQDERPPTKAGGPARGAMPGVPSGSMTNDKRQNVARRADETRLTKPPRGVRRRVRTGGRSSR